MIPYLISEYGNPSNSYVLGTHAKGVDPDVALGAIRFSVGRYITKEDIDKTIHYIAKYINETA